jgi:hypothetical protein
MWYRNFQFVQMMEFLNPFFSREVRFVAGQ